MRDENYRRRGVPIPLVILLGLLTMCAVFFGTYQWQQSRVVGVENEVSQLQTELTNLQKQKSTTTSYTSVKGVKINVFTPVKGETVTSPLVVLGEVPGNWSFEASFPVSIEDLNGLVENKVAAQLIGDWMTSDMVPFSATLDYGATIVGDGVLVLRRDNPSGLPENDDSVTIPLRFE